MLMREYFSNLIYFNFKIESINMLRLEKGLLYIYIYIYYFDSPLLSRENPWLNTTLEIIIL